MSAGMKRRKIWKGGGSEFARAAVVGMISNRARENINILHRRFRIPMELFIPLAEFFPWKQVETDVGVEVLKGDGLMVILKRGSDRGGGGAVKPVLYGDRGKGHLFL